MAEAAGGYDYVFISDIPEDLQCSLCHFPFKNPLQIEECGHHFCSECFEQTKDHVETNSLELCCPLDRQKINVARVFKDKYIERKVLSLEVKCRNFDDDCTWTGELREALNHEKKCGKKGAVLIESFDYELKTILQRVADIELKLECQQQNLASKEKQLDTQNQQIEYLKRQNEDQNQHINNLQKQGDEQKKQIDYLNKQIEDLNKQKGNEKIQLEFHNLSSQIKDQDQEIKILKKLVEHMNKELENKNKLFEDEIKKFQVQSNEVQKQKNELEKLQQSINVNSMIIENDEGLPNFSTGSTAFRWKFNVNNSISISPLFSNIMSSMKFQVIVSFEDNILKLFFVRIRCIYDHKSNELTTKMPHDFVVNIFGGNGKQKTLRFSLNTECNAATNDPMSRKAWVKLIYHDEVESLTINGYVHLHCCFQ